MDRLSGGDRDSVETVLKSHDAFIIGDLRGKIVSCVCCTFLYSFDTLSVYSCIPSGFLVILGRCALIVVVRFPELFECLHLQKSVKSITFKHCCKGNCCR